MSGKVSRHMSGNRMVYDIRAVGGLTPAGAGDAGCRAGNRMVLLDITAKMMPGRPTNVRNARLGSVPRARPDHHHTPPTRGQSCSPLVYLDAQMRLTLISKLSARVRKAVQ